MSENTGYELVAKALGPVAADPSDLPWKCLRAGMMLKPKARSFFSVRNRSSQSASQTPNLSGDFR
ncbi:hypothetical protein FAZ69_03350 [Trinickia terrae]|uniref:Uncharacterized protein n=1 Tax=Trinickia terrae TaxID=2571161 RepID=A0A4U1IDI0_9BURK|nr:hypothetical protein [Trinickia terrae]TKC91505.1 hypothetical protein FAZ69_03350 [Trinickia terrae]